ncbi:hypothetical protein AVEN_203328-1 [Araneus ventricosus]|uniref:Uncharacterized protein n=1 Tax=Araneus ventricosus TaxID=182803 RepID=A0A4Y2ERY4_ARAVE|nr:hypothetical protein AVEN_203328-1 [Araneus ventricosus]
MRTGARLIMFVSLRRFSSRRLTPPTFGFAGPRCGGQKLPVLVFPSTHLIIRDDFSANIERYDLCEKLFFANCEGAGDRVLMGAEGYTIARGKSPPQEHKRFAGAFLVVKQTSRMQIFSP